MSNGYSNIIMGDKSLPPNSNELERKCQNMKKILINEVDSFFFN